jgi:hypothetical protein
MINKDRIYKSEFDKIIKKTMGISPKERAYLDEVFANKLVEGLTKAGLEAKIAELRYSEKNVVSSWRLGKIRENIITRLTPEQKKD